MRRSALENDGMSGGPEHAVAGLLRQAARECGEDDVRLNGVSPGVIDAGIVHSSVVVDEVAMSVIQSCLAQTQLGRMGKPAEVASLVEYLVRGRGVHQRPADRRRRRLRRLRPSRA